MQYERLAIETPENVAFGYEVAGLGSRFLAALLDSFLIALLLTMITIVIFALVPLLNSFSFEAQGVLIAIYVIFNFIFFWGYYIFFELQWNGQTPGKRLLNLRTLERSGVPLGLTASLIRNLVRIVDFLPVFYGLGVVVMFINRDGLRLGDLAAGTLVVHDRQVSLDDLLQPVATTAAVVDLPALAWPLERLTADDLALVEAYLARRATLATERQLLRPILQHLYDRMEQPLEERIAYDEAVGRLQQIAAGLRQRQSGSQPTALPSAADAVERDRLA